MQEDEDVVGGGERRVHAAAWLVLLVLSVVFTLVLEWLALPAAPLLGPMAAAILMATYGRMGRIPRKAFLVAQAIVGTMIAENLPADIGSEIARDWPIFLLGTASTLLAAYILGWLLTRSQILPGTTAIWGSSPGGAAAMTLISESYGADMRLVAFMQYLRVAACAISAALVSRLFGAHGGGGGGGMEFAFDWAAVDWTAVGISLAIAALGAVIGVVLKIPGGAIVTPMGIAMALKLLGVFSVTLPLPILVLSYGVLGWGIGARFTREVVAYAASAFPKVLAAVLALLTVCAGFGGVLVLVADIDPLTAFLATSPGGADSVSIIAATSDVDVAFVIAMQMARFLCVLAVGPFLARLASRSIRQRSHDP